MIWNLIQNILVSAPKMTSRRPANRNQHQQFDSSAASTPVECLEFRVFPSALTIQFDYTYDTNHFFDTQEKKDLLQSVADLYSARITDDLAAITPTEEDTWNAVFTNPGTGTEESVHNLVVPADT